MVLPAVLHSIKFCSNWKSWLRFSCFVGQAPGLRPTLSSALFCNRMSRTWGSGADEGVRPTAMILSTCLALSSIAFAQTGTGVGGGVVRPPAPPEDRCQIEGTVVNAVTGEPLRKVQVALERSPGNADYGAVTDSEGRFTIQNIAPGSYRPAATRNGFVPAANAPGLLVLSRGQRLQDVKLRLLPQGVISGRIVDEDSDPIPQVFVQCLKYTYQQGKKQLVPVNASNTNDLGEYRLFGLTPGKYFLYASRRGAIFSKPVAQSTEQSSEEVYLPVFYPNGSTIDGAAAVQVTSGEAVHGMEMTLRHVHTVYVRGTVVNVLSNRAMIGAALKLTPRGIPGLATTRVANVQGNDQGAFEFRDVPPGSYILEGDTSDGGRTSIARMPLEVGNSNMDGVVLSVGLSMTLNGRVKVEEGGTGRAPSRLSVLLEPKTADLGTAASADVKDDGTFAFPNLAPAEYSVNVSGAVSGYYIRAMRTGDADVTDAGLDLSRGGAPGELSIVLSPGAAQADGTVQDAQQRPVPGMQVVLVPQTAKRDVGRLYKFAMTDGNGHFVIRDITPGDYKVFSWEQVESGAWRDPDFIKDYESKGEVVRLDPNGHATVQVQLIPAS